MDMDFQFLPSLSYFQEHPIADTANRKIRIYFLFDQEIIRLK